MKGEKKANNVFVNQFGLSFFLAISVSVNFTLIIDISVVI